MNACGKCMVAAIPVVLLTGCDRPPPAAAVNSQPVQRTEFSSEPQSTALVFDPLYLEHTTGPGFPESPERLRWLIQHLQGHPIGAALMWMQPDDTLDPLPWVRAIHTDDYIVAVKAACERGDRFMGGNRDCPISPRSYDVALRAVAGVLTAVDAVIAGRVRNAFAAVRPPGHHAMPDQARGFCIFGNAAIAARYARQAHGLERVMIIDWDGHHGDGTQAITFNDPGVFYFSTHQYPFYPGPSGAPDRIGAGLGEGFNLNVPLRAGSGDRAIREAFQTRLTEVFRRFQPQLVVISAGFDAHEDDPLGDLGWTSEVFGELTSIVRSLAREQNHERIISVLEGGYSRRGMTEAVRMHLEALLAAPPSEAP